MKKPLAQITELTANNSINVLKLRYPVVTWLAKGIATSIVLSREFNYESFLGLVENDKLLMLVKLAKPVKFAADDFDKNYSSHHLSDFYRTKLYPNVATFWLYKLQEAFVFITPIKLDKSMIPKGLNSNITLDKVPDLRIVRLT